LLLFFQPPNCETHQQPRLSQWGVLATQTGSIQAPVIAATNCNRFCGLAAHWNASVQTMALPRVALTAEEVAAAVGQQAMVFQELASALVEIR
jgi:hypothetical protein